MTSLAGHTKLAILLKTMLLWKSALRLIEFRVTPAVALPGPDQ